MTRLIRQIYTGKVLEVLREDEDWLQITNPEFPGTRFLISRGHYDAKWEPYKGELPPLSKSEGLELANEVPAKRGRGRPKGSKNRVKK